MGPWLIPGPQRIGNSSLFLRLLAPFLKYIRLHDFDMAIRE
jgi:hypothetical protein